MKTRYIFVFSIIFSLFLLENAVAAQANVSDDTSDTLTAKGRTFYQQGNYEEAMLAWEQAMRLSEPEKNTAAYLDTSLHLADVCQALGYHRKSIAVLEQAVARQSQDHSRNAVLLSRLADIYFSLGKPGKTAEYLAETMKEVRLSENPRVLSSVMINMGNALSADGDYVGAMSAYEKAISIAEQLEGESGMISKALINSLRVAFLSGNDELTSTMLRDIPKQINGFPDSHQKARDLISLALLIREIQSELSDSALAQSAYQALSEAGRISGNIGDFRSMSYAYGYMGQLYEDAGRHGDAMKLTRQAMFFAQQKKFPEILYLWQWQMGRLFKAGGDMEEAMKAYLSAISTLDPIRQELFQGYRSQQDVFNKSVKPVYLEITELLLRQAEAMAEGSEARKAKLKQARDTMELLKTAELQDFFGDECVDAGQAGKNTLEQTPPHTAVLFPIPMPDSLALLLTLPDGMKLIRAPVGAEEIKKTVTLYRERLQTRPNKRFIYESQKLYDWIIRPLESELTAQEIDTLVVAPDGALRLIPFATLYDGKQFLIEKYATATIPAIKLTNTQPFDKSRLSILLGGLSEGRQGFSPLPGVPSELKDIRTIMNAEEMIENKDYTVANLTRRFSTDAYAIVHVATHGVFGGTADDSFLLTYDSKLNMNQLEHMLGLGRFREQKVELLTMSACQTALGNERAAMGLAGVAVKAGVKGVIATLWFVDDEATSLAIREFYRQLRKPGLTKAKAMQNVQKNLISQRRYWHPLYWGPFLVIGNWM